MPYAKRGKDVTAFHIRRIDIGLILQDKGIQHAGLRRIAHLDRGRSRERDVRLEFFEALYRFFTKQIRAVKRFKGRDQKVKTR